nr:SDR family NAD(P)-dependent oxidoreductase [Devosia naphthalenivorans]
MTLSVGGLLVGKVAIVTGAGAFGGIGHAVAQIFADAGAKIALLDLDLDLVTAVAQSIGENAHAIACDVRDNARCGEAVDEVVARWGHIDALVNNAGVVQKRALLEISEDDLSFVLDTNLKGAFYMNQAAIPHMQSGSAIVTIASIAAQRGGGLMGGAHYAASKGGLTALARTMARELGGRGIRSNIVNPGVIHSPMTENGYSDEARKAVCDSTLLGRFGEAKEVAGACLFLVSSLSSYITGASIDVNGGMHIH